MDDICLRLLTTSDVERHRQRRSVVTLTDDNDRCVGRVSLISLFLATPNQSTTTVTTSTAQSAVTESVTSSPVLLVAERFAETVTFGLLPTVAIIGLVVNGLATFIIVGDRSPLSWRLLRCLAVSIDILLLTPLMIVVDVAAYFAVTSTAALNWLAAVVGFLQYVQPWTLYITATYVHRLLLDERHRVPPGRRVRCPLAQLVAMIVVGTVYFTLYVPPVRLMMYRSIASYSALCTVPLFDQWQLSVGQTASTDPVCYDCLYTLVVYLAPIFPLFYRFRRLVDAVFRRDYQSVAVRSGTALGSWADVV